MNGPERDPLLEPLRRAWEATDPEPEGLVERLLIALATEDLDLEYELLTMVHRSAQLAGTRSNGDDKLVLEFSAAGVTVMMRVSPVDSAHRRIDGWVSRNRDAKGDLVDLTASLWQEADTAESPVGTHGRFEFPSVPRGLTRLDLVAPGSAMAFRTTLFEI
jgi:hypothetical protein